MIQFKRYLVFGFDEFYPAGGWLDFRGTTDDLEEAIGWVQSEPCGHVVDTKSEAVIQGEGCLPVRGLVYEWHNYKEVTGWRERRAVYLKAVKAWVDGGQKGPAPKSDY